MQSTDDTSNIYLPPMSDDENDKQSRSSSDQDKVLSYPARQKTVEQRLIARLVEEDRGIGAASSSTDELAQCDTTYKRLTSKVNLRYL